MSEENISQEFRLKNIDKTRKYLIEQINRNESMNKNHKKVYTTLIYIEHFLILASTITGCASISDFASLAGIPIAITISAKGIKMCVVTEGIKKYKAIIKKRKKNHNKRVLLAKFKLNSIEVLIYKALIYLVISHNEFILINNEQNEYNDMKEEIINLKT